MSVNVYLKGEEVRKIEGFEVIEYKGEDGGPRKRHILPGLDLCHGKGRWYFMLHESTDPIPSVVADIVEEVSFHTWISSSWTREAGIYRHKSAEAEVEFPGKDNTIWIRIKAKKIEDLHELYRKIRIGSIRPAESYDGEQSGMSRKELEAQLKEAKESAEELGREYDRFRKLLEEAEDRITKLSLFEEEGLWAFLRRKFWKSSES